MTNFEPPAQPGTFGSYVETPDRADLADSPLGLDVDQSGEHDDLTGDDEPRERSLAEVILREWLPLLVVAFVFAMVIRTFVMETYSIPSGSMLPTLEVKDRVLVNKLSYNAHDVNRGDVVVFDRPANTPGRFDVLIKRVMGLPGETIQISNGDLYIDGQLVQESYILEPQSTQPLSGIPNCTVGTAVSCIIPDDMVFVMGDNRLGSTDSRLFGPIPIDSIVGRAFVKVWPLDDLELV